MKKSLSLQRQSDTEASEWYRYRGKWLTKVHEKTDVEPTGSHPFLLFKHRRKKNYQIRDEVPNIVEFKT